MSRKYKFGEATGAYFISFATVYWIDVFTRLAYFDSIIESLDCGHERDARASGGNNPEWHHLM